MRRFLTMVTVLGLLLSLAPGMVQADETTAPASAPAPVSTLPPAPIPAAPPVAPGILLDGYPLAFLDGVGPQIVNNRTLAPFRVIAEALGVSVTWHQKTQTIEAVGPGKNVRLTIDDPIMLVDGAQVLLDVPPMIVNGRTLIPLRAFSTAFGAKVDWDSVARNAIVNSPARPMQTLGFYAIRSFGERDGVAHFSDVAYGWATLTADGQVDTTSDATYKWPEPAGDITGEGLLADAQAVHTRRYLMVYATDTTNALTALVKNNALVDKVGPNVAAVVAAKGFDGVVLDLEGLGCLDCGEKPADLPAVQQGFSRLVAGVAAALHPLGKQVIVAVHPLNGAYHGYDYQTLATRADSLIIMAYKYRMDGGTEPMDRVDEAIRLALQQVGKEKLLLGILVGGNGENETAVTIPQKIGLAKRYGLAGVSLWRIGVIGADRMTAWDAAVTPIK